VTKIASILGGFTLSEADLLRRAMGKKKPEEMQSQREMFLSRATEQGAELMVAEKIFDNMANFAGYGFNKSHSAAYAVITYRTAYLKAHYPVVYMAALMSGEIGNNEKVAFYFGVCRKMGIRILPPDVNESFTTFTAVGENIRFGLAAVRNVGESAVNEIIEARKMSGPFLSFQDFCMRVNINALNQRMLDALIRCGAFDSLGATRSQLLGILPEVLNLAGVYQRERREPQVSLFDLLNEIPSQEPFHELQLPAIADWSDKEKLQNEKQFLGFYVSGHPLDKFLVDMQSFSTASSGTVATLRDGAPINLLGIITKVSTKLDKRGNTMAFADLEDFEGSVELVIFREPYDKFRSLLAPDSVVWVEGTASSRSGKKITVRRVTTVEQMRQRLAKYVTIALPATSASEDNLKALRDVLARHKGACRLRLVIGGVKVLAGKSFALEPSNKLIEEIQALAFEKVLTFSEK
jgi:DNA polymerase-3 subunit alpha